MRFYVYNPGDPSVGIQGDVATVDINVDHLEGEDRNDFIQQIKEELKRSFGNLWDFGVSVWTKEEAEADAQQYMTTVKDEGHEFQPVYQDKDADRVWGFFKPKVDDAP